MIPFDFVAEVTVMNIGRIGAYEEVALSHIFPSGWEIHYARLDVPQGRSGSGFDYQDIRDDRIYTYFDIDRIGQRPSGSCSMPAIWASFTCPW